VPIPDLEENMNIILFWNSVLLECSRRDFTRGFNNSQQPGPIRTSRAMAIVHLAIHDAVAFETNKAAAAYLNKKAIPHTIGAPPAGSALADTVAGAAVTAIKAMYPRYTAFIDDAHMGQANAAFNYGKSIADALLAARAADGSTVMVTAPQDETLSYGQHRADPFAPNQPRLGLVWGNVTRFTGAGHQALDPYPGSGTTPLVDDPAYLEDYEEVREYGAADRRQRTAEQERIGVYWGYDGVMNLGVPPRLYNQIARTVVASRNLSVPRTAELFAQLNVAMADAGIDAWHWKYHYDLWRPVVGIRYEPAPDGDAFWAPLGAPQTNVGGRYTLTPPFPAYPSGHATFGAALFQTLRLALGTDTGPITLADVLVEENGPGDTIANEVFTFVSDELDGISMDPNGSVRQNTPITFPNFARAVWENSVSRIYLGVHWRFDGIPRVASQNVGGVPLGLAIGEEAHAFFNGGVSL
jgi:Vanadium chloroperoxidase N-terminal domain/PAP2 superfamily